MREVVALIAGFLLLIKGADFLVKGASALARRLKVSDLAVGLTVVAFGTSCPELFVNIIASLKGESGIVLGNIVGSNIANIYLILGLSAVIYPLQVTPGTVWKEIPFAFLAAVMFALMVNDRLFVHARVSSLSVKDGFLLLAFFGLFLWYSFRIGARVEGAEDFVPGTPAPVRVSVLWILAGIAGLAGGAHLIVSAGTRLAGAWGVSTTFVGLTLMALGTSLPELATSTVAAFHKNPDIAVGNVIGSNIFNILFILGLSAVLRPVPVAQALNFDILVMVFAHALLFIFMFTGKKRKVDRWEGIVFILLYFVYLVFLVRRG